MTDTTATAKPTPEELAADPHFVPQEAMPRRDPLLNDERILIEIDVRPLSQVVCGHVCQKGINRIVIASSQLAAVEALVETDKDRADLEKAREMYRRALKRFLEQDSTHTEAKFAGSVEGEFQKIAGCGFPPIVSLKVLERGLQRQATEREEQHQDLAKTVAAAVAAALAGVAARPNEDAIASAVAAGVREALAATESAGGKARAPR